MIFTNSQISYLPTLKETVEFLSEVTANFPIVHRSPYSPIIYNEDVDILSRSGEYYYFKPNISCQGALFGWCNDFNELRYNKFEEAISPSQSIELHHFFRKEFNKILNSHPFYRLLKDGFRIPGLLNAMKIYNPEGLAMSYGFNSSYIPLTSSIEIAAFHASHIYNPTDNTFSAITNENKTGVIFIFELKELFSLIKNISVIGRQPFLRPGLNKLFAYHNTDYIQFQDLPNVKGFQFRHNKNSTLIFSRVFENGKFIFPDEPIVKKVQLLKSIEDIATRSYQSTFRQHSKYNTYRYKINQNRTISEILKEITFSPDELSDLWFANAYKIWEDFWTDRCYTRFNNHQLRYLVNLPKNPLYKKFFDLNHWIDFNNK